MVKNAPAMQEIWVQSLAWEDPLKKEMATHSCRIAWRIPWTEELGRLHSPWIESGQATIHRVAESDMTEQTFTHSANKLI